MGRRMFNEAAGRLGVSKDAVRKRIQRGTLAHGKWPDGRSMFTSQIHHQFTASGLDSDWLPSK